MGEDDNGLRKTIGYSNKFWKNKSQKGMTDEQKLQEFHKDEHAARYGAKTSKYKWLENRKILKFTLNHKYHYKHIDHPPP